MKPLSKRYCLVLMTFFLSCCSLYAQQGANRENDGYYVTHYYAGGKTVMSHFTSTCSKCLSHQSGAIDISGLFPYDAKELFRCSGCESCNDNACRTVILYASADFVDDTGNIEIRITHLDEKGNCILKFSGKKVVREVRVVEKTFRIKESQMKWGKVKPD